MEKINIVNPVYVWKQKITDDGPFTRTRISAIDRIMEAYTDNLYNSEDNTDIWKTVEKVVKSINRLNKNEEFFISAADSEALVDFIRSEAEKSGLTYAGDVTEEWREEW